MTRGEKRVLMKSIKELPKGDHDRILEIVRDHCITSGKDFSDKVTVNLEISVRHHLIVINRFSGPVKLKWNKLTVAFRTNSVCFISRTM